MLYLVLFPTNIFKMISESTVAVYIEIFDAETSDTYDIDMGGGSTGNARTRKSQIIFRSTKMQEQQNDRPNVHV